MAILSTRTQLTPELERRRRTEAMRDRLAMAVPYLAGAAAAAMVVLVIGGLVGLGGSHPGARAKNPFAVPHRGQGANAPLIPGVPGGSPTPSGSPSSTPSSTPTGTTPPPTTPSPSPSGTSPSAPASPP